MNCRACRDRVVFLLLMTVGLSGLLWKSATDHQRVQERLRARESEVARLEDSLREARMKLEAREEALARLSAHTDALIGRLLDVRLSGGMPLAAAQSAVPPIPQELRRLAGASRPSVPSAAPRDPRKVSAAGKGRKEKKGGKLEKAVFKALGVRKNRLYYLAFDGQVHVASPGDPLHGVDGEYRGYDAQRKVVVLRLGKRVLELKATVNG